MPDTNPILNAPVYDAKDYQGNVIAIKTRADAVHTASGATVESELTAVKSAVSGQTGCQVVADIAERDALTGMKPGDQVWVLDATADATVNSGAAQYIYVSTETGWVKTAETESMDVVVQWGNVQGTEAVQDAVAKKHEHANKALLDGIVLDEAAGTVTIGGKTYYSGRQVVVLEAGEPIPADMHPGGIVLQKVEAV